MVTVPAFTVSIAVTDVTLRSFFNLRPIFVSSPVCVISVVILSSPFTVTLEPSLFVFSLLLSASKRRPLLVSSVFASPIFLLSSVLVSAIFLFNSVLVSPMFLFNSVFVSAIFLFNSVLVLLMFLFNSVFVSAIFLFNSVLALCN